MTYVDRLLTTTPTIIAAGHSVVGGTPMELGGAELAPLLSVLFLKMDETRSVVVAMTSAHGGAGTSTVARKLAEAAAATGWCRVALLDARADSDAPGAGLVETIEKEKAPVLTTRRIGAFTVDVGRLCTRERSLSRVEGVRDLYGRLREQYSLIVVDCPAVFAGQQTLMVAGAADDTVLVVEAERTALADVARARAALERRGARVLGMVMNKSRSRVPALFGGRA